MVRINNSEYQYVSYKDNVTLGALMFYCGKTYIM